MKFNKFVLTTTTTALLSSSLMIGSAMAHIKHYDDKASYTKATGKTITKLHESPYIKKYMPKLKPINVRLKGLDPFIEKPTDTIGIYGGQANIATMAPYAGQDVVGFMPYEMLLSIESDDRSIISGIAQSYKLSKDLKSITFTLRKGIKWSDGVPLTAYELHDWYKYITLGLKMNPPVDKMTFTVANARQFTISIEDPNAFLANLFSSWAGSNVVKPFHYIKQFLPQFNKHVKQDALKAGYKDVSMYIKAKANAFNVATGSLKLDTNVPSLSAYVLTKKSSDHWTFTRNPYYWRVDTHGNQLPYIDKLQLKLLNSEEILPAQVISGAIDYSKYNNSTAKMTLFKQNEKQGHFKTYVWSTAYASQPAIGFNIAYNGPDKVGAKIIRDLRFRKAFSLMINRQKMNDTLYFGKALPTQMTAHNTSQYYKKEYAEAYAQYDPKQANKLLDQMGLKWDKSHKFRLRPDGKKLSFLIGIVGDNGASSSLNFEMIQSFAKDVGIQILLKSLEWVTLMHNNTDGNISLLSAGDGSGTTDPALWPNPLFFVPNSANNSNQIWGMNYAKWFDARKFHRKADGVEPPQYVKDLYDTYTQLLSTNDLHKRAILADKILKAQAEHLFTVGIIANPPKPVTARDNMKNIEPHGYSTPDNKWGSNYGPETKFFTRPLYKNQITK